MDIENTARCPVSDVDTVRVFIKGYEKDKGKVDIE